MVIYPVDGVVYSSINQYMEGNRSSVEKKEIISPKTAKDNGEA